MSAHPLSSTGTKHLLSCLPAANRTLVVTVAVLMVHLAATGSARAASQEGSEPASVQATAAPGTAGSATGSAAGKSPAPAAVPGPPASPAPPIKPETTPAVKIAESTDTSPGTGAAPGAGAAPAGGAPPGAKAPPGGGPPGMPPGGPPPLPVLLGFADTMMALDRPYEAEKIYKAILSFDPKNPAALAGLRAVEIAKRPTFQLLSHYYQDNHDVELFTYGGGPTFRTPYGRVTVTAGTGTYRNNNDPTNSHNPLSLTPTIPTAADNHSLKKSTLNLILEPYFGKWDGTVLVSRVTYDGAPDRTLWDLRATYTTDLRRNYTVSHGRHDSFFQNQAQQFFAPETYFMLVDKITYQDTSVTVQHPIVGKLDLLAAYRYFSYSDGNTRDNYRVLSMYRLQGDKKRPMPVFRVGLDTILDNSKFFTLNYSSSRQFNVVSLAADYLWITRRNKLFLFASYPIAKQHFNPPASFVGLFNHQIDDRFDVYAQVVGFLPPADGVSLSFGDYVVGVNIRF